MMQARTQAERDQKAKMSEDELIRHKTIHRIIHYGHERSQVDADESVAVTTDKIMVECYGEYNWRKEFFKHASGDLAHRTFTENAIREVKKRAKYGDYLLCFWGSGHAQVADAVRGLCIIVEPGIGYPVESSLENSHKIFESYAWMHVHYGERKIIHPSHYDCTIGNYFDPLDFEFRAQKGNYFLYLGRIFKHKGLDIVVHLAKTMGFRLVLAGQGSLEEMGYTSLPCNIQQIGFADVEKRRELMAGARALLLTTYYIEPFGGVTMEAMMSGTPVITCDCGVFTETVLHGVTGFRCRTLDHYYWAIRNIDRISPQACREWAMRNYSLPKVRSMYEEYFDMLANIFFGAGFYAEDKQRTQLDWLKKDYPVEACSEFQELSLISSAAENTSISANNACNSVENASSSEVRAAPALVQHQQKVARKRIAIFCEIKWAFGRIAQALQKFSNRFDICIFDWTQGFNDRMLDFDLIYATVWDTARQLEQQRPALANKIVFSGHGLVDFVKMKFDELVNRDVSNEQIKEFDVDPRLIRWIVSRKTPFSVVSHQLLRALAEKCRFVCECDQNTPATCGAACSYVDRVDEEKKRNAELIVKNDFQSDYVVNAATADSTDATVEEKGNAENKEQTGKRVKKEKELIYLTQCGVDPAMFFRQKRDSSTEKLRVLFTYPKESNSRNYGYDAKRKGVVAEVDKHFSAHAELGVEIVFTPSFLPIEKMNDFYKEGDVFLCLSHSEGNPLGAFEAGACGLTVVSTRVGEMPVLIRNGENGFLIENGDDEQVRNDAIARLSDLARDRSLLNSMKNAMYEEIIRNWTWEKKITQWEAFFDACLERQV